MNRSCSVLGACAFPNCDCPLRPESETPETDKLKIPSEALLLLGQAGVPEKIVQAMLTLGDHARSLERRLSLAQTEIKGHMRVEDELKRTLHDFGMKVGDVMLKISHALKGDPEKDIFEGSVKAAEQAQSRIAELELALSQAREMFITSGLTQCAIAIDAALKSRA